MTDLKHVFKLWNGEVIIVPQRDARRTIDKRGEHAPAETVWEVTTDKGVRRLWPEEIQSWDAEEV
jgi:hypothetical protein